MRGIVTVLVLAMGIAVWVLMRGGDPGAAGGAETGGEAFSEAAEAPDRAEGRTDTSVVAPAAGDEREREEGASVDLDGVDRDLDLHGVVVTAKETPVAGARVVAIAHPFRRVTILDVDAYAKEVEVAETRSVADGTFALRLSRGAVVELRVEADGFATETLAARHAGERVTVRLTLAGTLVVVCTDEGGAPVTDAAVSLWRRAHGTSYGRREARTDGDGKAVFEGMRPGDVSVAIQPKRLGSPGWLKAEVVAGDVTPLAVTLPAGRSIAGRITDARTGRAIEGARIGENWVLDRPVESGADGRYVFPGWTGNGVRDLHVTADGYGRQGKEVPENGALDFTLSRGDSATGRVLDAAGAPVAGAFVTAVASDWAGIGRIDSASGESDDDGSFSLTSLRRELPHTLVVQATGHGRTLLDFDPHPGGPGVVALGDVALPAARRLEGRALGPDGAPLSDVRVRLVGHNADRNRLRPSQEPLDFFYGKAEGRRTDDRGRFRFADLSPGSYELTLRAEGFPDTSRSVVLNADRDLVGVTLRLQGGSTLVVRVIDVAGAPVEDVQVNLLDTSNERLSRRTDERGEATFQGLTEMKVRIGFWAGERPYIIPADWVVADVADGLVQVTLRRRATISGRVVDGAGSPLAALQVTAVGADDLFAGTTDDDGLFEIMVPAGQLVDVILDGRRLDRTEIRPGSFHNSVHATPYRARLVDVLPPREDLLLVAHEVVFDGVVRVRVIDGANEPVAGAQVFLVQNEDVRSTAADDEGRVVFEGLPLGAARVSADGPEDGTTTYYRSGAADVEAGAEEVTLVLRPGAVVRGRVVDSTGLPVTADLRLSEEGTYPAVGLRTRDDGRFAFTISTDGRWFLRGTARLEDRAVPIPRREIFPTPAELEIRLTE